MYIYIHSIMNHDISSILFICLNLSEMYSDICCDISSDIRHGPDFVFEILRGILTYTLTDNVSRANSHINSIIIGLCISISSVSYFHTKFDVCLGFKRCPSDF